MTHSIKVLVLGLCLATPALTLAADEDPNAEAAHVRHALMEVVSWHMKEIVAMSTNRQPFDAERATLLGERLVQLGGMIGDAFAVDTRGADIRTAALDAVWESPDDFSMKTEELIVVANAYAEAARNGPGDARKAFIQLGGGCKGCHEKFKAEED